MARFKTLMAVCLALVLALSVTPMTWAGGPTGNDANSSPTDGGDGHPWDDGTSESTDPGDGSGTEDPLEIDQLLTPMLTRSVNPGGADWVRGLIVKLWQEVVQTKIGRKLMGSRIARIR